MTDKILDLIGFDNPFLDLVIEIDRLPASNTNCPMRSHCFQGGGNVATALVAASRLGLKAALMGCVGDDLFGKMSIADLKYNNIDVSRMKTSSNKKSNFSLLKVVQPTAAKPFEGVFSVGKPDRATQFYFIKLFFKTFTID